MLYEGSKNQSVKRGCKYVQCKLLYHVKSPRKARSPSAMVFVEGNVMIFPAALDWAESSAPFGSAARIRIEGFMAFAARATPEIKPPPVVQPKSYASAKK